MTKKDVWSLDEIAEYMDGPDGRDAVELFGGKAVSLVRMQRNGLKVPAALVIPARVTPPSYKTLGNLVNRLDEMTQGRWNNPDQLCLVSVRSGARVSMPGMMDTVLNVGLTRELYENHKFLSVNSSKEELAFIEKNLNSKYFPNGSTLSDEDKDSEKFEKYLDTIRKAGLKALHDGRDFSLDPDKALQRAVKEVFESWHSDRAISYREMKEIPHSWGTACIVQEMVFGNRDNNSGTGVLFSRNPTTGESKIMGDYLPMGQGEAVVSGTAETLPIEEMPPDLYEQLVDATQKMEIEYRDMVDIEFTVESGELYFLQCRPGKRTAEARVKILVEMIYDPVVSLTYADARAQLNELSFKVVLEQEEDLPDRDPDACGHGAGIGIIEGTLTPVIPDEEGTWILVKEMTEPDDVAEMTKANAVVTVTGGVVSHAAIVCREMNIPAVVGCGHFQLLNDATDRKQATINARTGEIWVHEPAAV